MDHPALCKGMELPGQKLRRICGDSAIGDIWTAVVGSGGSGLLARVDNIIFDSILPVDPILGPQKHRHSPQKKVISYSHHLSFIHLFIYQSCSSFNAIILDDHNRYIILDDTRKGEGKPSSRLHVHNKPVQ